MKKLIFSADDFAKCDEMDSAILKGFQTGILTSTCIMANGANYDKAVNELLPEFPFDFKNGGLGCHLNIIEGKSLLEKSDKSRLCGKNGIYNKGFIYMLLNSYNKDFMEEVEKEFRSQIEKLLNDPKIGIERLDHINSHVHTHAVPAIFELTCNLAKEYGFEAIRTQREPFYTVSYKKYREMGFINVFLNLAKNVLLNLLSIVNSKTAQKYGLKTNDKFLGLLFTGFMDEETVLKGLDKIALKDSVTEILVHPYLYTDNEKINEFKQTEFLLLQNDEIKCEIVKKSFDFIRFVNIFR